MKRNGTKLLKNGESTVVLEEPGKREQMETESCCESAGLSGGGGCATTAEDRAFPYAGPAPIPAQYSNTHSTRVHIHRAQRAHYMYQTGPLVRKAKA